MANVEADLHSPREAGTIPGWGCCGFRRRYEELESLRRSRLSSTEAGFFANEPRSSVSSLYANEARSSVSSLNEAIPREEREAALHALAPIAEAAARRRAKPSGQTDLEEVEGMLAAAQKLLAASLSSAWLFPATRQDLEKAAGLLDAAEHELRASRLSRMWQGGRRGAVFCHSDPLMGLQVKQPVDSWLLQTFTDADPEAAEGHHLSIPSFNHNGPVKPWQPGDLRRFRSFADLDQSLAVALHDTKAEVLLERTGRLDFDTLAFAALPNIASRPLQVLGAYTLDQRSIVRSLCDQGQVPESLKFYMCLVRFLGEIEELYRTDIPYHTAVHAADVMMTMEWFLQTGYLRDEASALDHLLVLTASAIHDVGHPGRNNLFLSKTLAPEAIRYNDKSILENMHLALSFETMQGDVASNWFALLPRAFHRKDDEPGAAAVNVQHYVRRGLIDLVLGTDMARHAEHLQQLQGFLDAQAGGDPDQCQSSKQVALERKLFLLTTTLHAADISNPCKPRAMMLRWTQRVLDEFWAQGDDERARGVDVSPMCDRESGRLAIAKGQIGFIGFVVQPLYSPLARLIPEVADAMELLLQNRAFWEETERAEVPPEDIFSGGGRL